MRPTARDRRGDYVMAAILGSAAVAIAGFGFFSGIAILTLAEGTTGGSYVTHLVLLVLLEAAVATMILFIARMIQHHVLAWS